MRYDTVATFLTRLADRSPTPGGGATAALHAAQAAALVAMVGRYSDTAKYAAYADRFGAPAFEPLPGGASAEAGNGESPG